MSDFLLQIGAHPRARKLITALGVPVPQKLRRNRAPWAELPLDDQDVVVGGVGELHPALAEVLAPAGARVHLVGAVPHQDYADAGEAHGRPVARLGADEAGPRPLGLIFDATGLKDHQDLAALHAFFQPRLRGLRRCGRVVVLCRPVAQQRSAAAAAAARALDGFVRSVAKELGRKGSTAQLLHVAPGAEARLAEPLRFLLSARSAYVSGQPLLIDARAQAPQAIPFARSLAGKVALVTGAARGIGAATAAILAREGARVVCLDRPADDEPLARVARQIDGDVLAQDIAAEGAAAAIAEACGGSVDVVVHNAGVTRDKTLARMDAERWEQTLQVNLGAVIRTTEELLASGALARCGRVVCLSSISGLAGNVGQTNYAASKAGIIGFVQHLADEVAGRGITINAVAPGFIETRMTARMPRLTREVARRLCNLSQGGLPADVGEAVAFLASPGACGITGATLRVCGGSLVGA